VTIAVGTRLGPYEVLAPLGAGGMREVWKARDTRLDRSVAIKILPAELAQNSQFKLRFEREAKMISQLNHPHICTLFDVGDGYLVMELLEGESLADRIARGPLPPYDVLRYGVEIAEGLDKAHRAGVVHRAGWGVMSSIRGCMR
jgi:eukaryotic-like serine/threonine-protein kinase